MDEALIAVVTELPRTGENWFNTTVTKNVEFRSYLKPNTKILYGRRAFLRPISRRNGNTC